MGYTHHWKQPKDFTAKAWKEACEDIQAILTNVEHVQGVPLSSANGEGLHRPEVTDTWIAFNGLGDDSHESCCVYHKRPPLESWQKPADRGSDFCKTAGKPYDVAVTAVLAYLEAAHGFSVDSDGSGTDWLAGVAVARAAVPRYANQIDIPLSVRKADRWSYRNSLPISNNYSDFGIGLCIDGYVYVYNPKDERECYRFASTDEAREFFTSVKEPKFKPRRGHHFRFTSIESRSQPLFETSGSYDAKRANDLRREQNKVLSVLIESGKVTGRNIQPPAFARPKALLAPNEALPADLSAIYDLVEA